VALTRIGHKGADALVPGNTIASFEKAFEVGVDVIEFDVLWLESGRPETTAELRSPLVVAHDWHAAANKEQLTLDDALAAFTKAPLDQVKVNLDFKLPGREDEAIEMIRRHGLVDRLTISTMEVSTVLKFKELAPEISRGWTVPKVTKDWLSKPAWMKPALGLGLLAVRQRMPGIVRNGIVDLEPDAIWAFFGVLSPRLIEVIKSADLKLNVWTVDSPERIASLEAMGVDGICSNDPRLFQPNF
jgi:glycerophosphoryl diester phosphodiesterase